MIALVGLLLLSQMGCDSAPMTVDSGPEPMDSGFDSGTDGGDVCAAAATACPGGDETCIEEFFDTDEMNCGACGATCGENEECIGGACSCGEETWLRGEGRACRNMRICIAGVGCTDCEEGRGDCDPLVEGCETDITTSLDHCGACDFNCTGEGGPFEEAECVAGICEVRGSGCPAGSGDCDDDPTDCETNTNINAMHCGGCGMACALPHVAMVECVEGACAIVAGGCEEGYGDCNGDPTDGCEQRLNESIACGSCDITCGVSTMRHASFYCDGDTDPMNPFCAILTCLPDYGDCDSDPMNGCEAHLPTSNENCGSCGRVCRASTCVFGSCQCEGGLLDCDTTPFDCEVNPANDPLNCGGCNRRCGPNATCNMGVCVCDPQRFDCNSSIGTAGDHDGCETPQSEINCGACGSTGAFCGMNETCLVGGQCECMGTTGAAGAGRACTGSTSCCSTGCVDLGSDSNNCGACGLSCGPHSFCNGVGACVCEADWIDCDATMPGCETDATTEMNCRACGNMCAPGAACGPIGCACAPGRAECDGNPSNGCEAVLTSDEHCGGCNESCGSNASCGLLGDCSCDNPRTGDCNGDLDTPGSDGCEASLFNSHNTCGACTSSVCGVDEYCEGTTCRGCGGSAGEIRRDCNLDGIDDCEVDIASNHDHCGACGVDCGPRTYCDASSCTSCLPGFDDCDNDGRDGCEVNLNTDPLDCGVCGTTCSMPSICDSGFCCADPLRNCDGTRANGCEVDTSIDPLNCGDCGAICHSDQSCSSGLCECPSGLGDCDGILPMTGMPGCETDLTTNAAHCGACGNACEANEVCMGGSCGCASGFADCDGDPSNGCEVNLTSDGSNCGSCFNSCSTNQVCSAGSCDCAMGFADCTSVPGCETELATSTAHCGACDNACAANEVCTGVSCDCAMGFANCDGVLSNGCEVELASDALHCGTCTNSCSTNEVCSSGVCTCDSGFADCTAEAGCETNTNTDHDNCGGCDGSGGDVCTSTQYCNSGSCSSCPASGSGARDCDRDGSNACEINIYTDAANCNGCGPAFACAANQICDASGSMGVCQCDATHDECDMDPITVCETDLNTSAAHCGSCMNSCEATQTCSGGSCDCDSIHAECDMDAMTVCETDLTTTTNCGGCGVDCGANSTCLLGGGLYSCGCASGYENCNGTFADGCEVMGASCP